jgi:hypothetical protein
MVACELVKEVELQVENGNERESKRRKLEFLRMRNGMIAR